MIRVNCIERFLWPQNVRDVIDHFNENFNDYLNKAATGQNPYELEIDKEWANFIYKSSKMTFFKILAIFVAIAPSFTKLLSFFTTPFTLKGCYLGLESDPNPTSTLPFHECVQHNGESAFYSLNLEIPQQSTPLEILVMFLLAILAATLFLFPHIIFFLLVQVKFQINKYTVWMSAARIQLSTREKRCSTFISYVLLIWMVFVIYSFTEVLASFKDFSRRDISFPYNGSTRIFYIFEKENPSSPLALLSTGLVYACLIVVLFTQIRQPMSLFMGFRDYLKEASHVPYNIAAIQYRIERDALNSKFIARYYQECERYDPRVVLIAMTTHFLDLGILQVEGANPKNSHISIKSE